MVCALAHSKWVNIPGWIRIEDILHVWEGVERGKDGRGLEIDEFVLHAVLVY